MQRRVLFHGLLQTNRESYQVQANTATYQVPGSSTQATTDHRTSMPDPHACTEVRPITLHRYIGLMQYLGIGHSAPSSVTKARQDRTSNHDSFLEERHFGEISRRWWYVLVST